MKQRHYLFHPMILALILFSINSYGQGFTYVILNVNSGKALEIGGNYSQTLAAGRLAIQNTQITSPCAPIPAPCNTPTPDATNQEWYFQRVSDLDVAPYYRWKIINKRSGLVLEAGGSSTDRVKPGVQMNQWYYTGTPNQHWYISQVSPPGTIIPEFRIYNVESGYTLEVAGTGGETFNSGRPVVQWYYFPQPKQYWKIGSIQNGVWYNFSQ